MKMKMGLEQELHHIEELLEKARRRVAETISMAEAARAKSDLFYQKAEELGLTTEKLATVRDRMKEIISEAESTVDQLFVFDSEINAAAGYIAEAEEDDGINRDELFGKDENFMDPEPELKTNPVETVSEEASEDEADAETVNFAEGDLIAVETGEVSVTEPESTDTPDTPTDIIEFQPEPPVDVMPEPTAEQIEDGVAETEQPDPVELLNNPVSVDTPETTVEQVEIVVPDTRASSAVNEGILQRVGPGAIIYNNDGQYITDESGARWFIFKKQLWRNNVKQDKTRNVLRAIISKEGLLVHESFNGQFFLASENVDHNDEVMWSKVII